MRIARAASSSDTTIDSSTHALSSGHIVGSTDFPPAPSTNDACQASKRLACPARERHRQRRRGLRLRGVDTRVGPKRLHRAADAGQQPAAAERRDDRVDVGQILEDLEPDRAVAGNEVVVVERMDEPAAHPVGAVLLDRAPAFVVRWR